MEKEFIPFEQALELKRLGFNEPCLASYETAFSNKPDFHISFIKDGPKNYVLVPLYQQVFVWFRDKYNLSGVVYDNCMENSGFNASILDMKTRMQVFEGETLEIHAEAELSCLINLIDIVKTTRSN